MKNRKIKAVALIGPTGIGKTALSLEIAERFAGEIVSVDSMQVYRFMDVGTAKASLEERGRVVHHLIDIIFPDEDYNVARFAADAAAALTDIDRHGRLPLLVGGTGLYLKGLLKGLFAIKEDPVLRRRLQERVAAEGLQTLYEELLDCDPESAARIHPRDAYRVVRAIEVFHTTGVPWSQHLSAQRHAAPVLRDVLKLGLSREREELYQRLDLRAEAMVGQGLLREVENLLALGYGRELKSMQSIGYRHMSNYLAGLWTWEESLAFLTRDTRHYAKRQLTWFRREPEIAWFHPEEKERIFAAIDRFLGTSRAGEEENTT